jgi:DNA uptake protein ComE-like DNA-binding protein
MGLQSINGVGEKGAAAVIKERAYGDFESVEQLP